MSTYRLRLNIQILHHTFHLTVKLLKQHDNSLTKSVNLVYARVASRLRNGSDEGNFGLNLRWSLLLASFSAPTNSGNMVPRCTVHLEKLGAPLSDFPRKNTNTPPIFSQFSRKRSIFLSLLCFALLSFSGSPPPF